MTKFRREFARRLRFAREMRELSQTDLGERTKLGQTHISHFEAATRLPDTENLKALCKGLMVSADYLLGLSERV
jgi:transcriptional regulator with XRE-family HTH domain